MAENLKDILGLPQSLTDFPDGKERTLYPVTMKNFPIFLDNFSNVNVERLWANFVFPEGALALKNVLALAFKDEDIEILTEQITPKNYKSVMDMILAVNGLEFQVPDLDIGEDNEKNEIGV